MIGTPAVKRQGASQFGPDDLVNRRTFLGGAALLALGVAGCGPAGKASTANGPERPGPFVVLPDTFDFFAGITQRVAFALATNGGDAVHPTGPVSVQIGDAHGRFGPPQVAVLHGDGLANPYLLAYHRFDAPGLSTLRVAYRGGHSDLPIQVIRTSSTPIPTAGKAMISVPTPTVSRPLGVNPVCTNQPPCPFHAVSLDTALAAHQRVALIFATPALCQSRFCGPTLDNLVAAHQRFAGRITFIHCEIYTDLGGQTATPPVTAYHLQHEPMLLLAAPDGTVTERIDNAFDRAEAIDALGRLAQG